MAFQYSEDFERFWVRASRIHGRPSKRQALKSYEKRAAEAQKDGMDEPGFVRSLVNAIEAEEAWRKLKHRNSEFVPEWPHWTTYLNQYRDQQEYMDKPTSELKQSSYQFSCVKCGVKENISRLNDTEFACEECRWEYYSGETRNFLQRGLKKAYELLPKHKGETFHEYWQRFRKVASLTKPLPYNKRCKLVEESAADESILTGRTVTPEIVEHVDTSKYRRTP